MGYGIVVEKISDLETKVSFRAEVRKQKRDFVRSLYPNDKNKRQEIYNDNKIFQGKFEAKRLKDLLKIASTTNQEFRMLIVQRRDAKTLIPIIQRNLKVGSDINSDKWRAYNKINQNGYQHFTVNHKENFVIPNTGKHTQLVKC